MNKAIFLDRDGTINVEKHYLYRIEDFEFLPGSIDALKQFQSAGYLLILITNQSGIGRGYYTEDDFCKLNNWMIGRLKEYGIDIADVYYCPHLPDAEVERYRKDCNCRKPKLGMFQKAVDDYDIDLRQSYAIGDKIRDCAICEDTVCKGFLIGQNEKFEVIENAMRGGIRNVRYAIDLVAAAKEILNKDRL